MSTKKKKKDASCRNKHAVVSNFVHDGVFYGCICKPNAVGDHIYHGMELCQSYFGQKVSFQVKSVETVKHDVPFDCVFWDHESSVDELAEIVESLDVSIGPIHQSVSYENCPLQTLSCFDCQPVILGHNPNANSIEGSPTNDSSFSSASVFSVQDSAAMIFLEVTELSRFEIYEETSCVRTQTDMFMLINFDSIGGLDKQIQELNHFCIHPLQNGTYGIPLQTGFLFHGPPGTGKSLFATALANELKAKPFYLSPADFIDSKSGLEKMRKAFRDVSELSHGIIIIDRLDVLCPHQSFLPTTDQKNTEHNLMSMMERLLSTANNMVIVIAIASNIGDVAPDLLKHGVFNKAIYFEVPSPLQRQQILQKMLLTVACDVSDEQVASIARDAHGFVGADLFQCFTKARFRLFCCKQSTGRLSYADLRQAMKEVTPSALVRETCEVDQVRWNDIAGMDSVKLQLRQMVEWPLKHPEIFQSLGALPPHQLLLYGPPGCSKTMLAKAVACESGLNFLSVKGPELLSKYVGESEKAARRLFDKARQSAPTVIFFDEVDSLCVDRSLSGNVTHGILATITQEMDTVATHGLDVFIIAATNRLDFLDPAFKARFRNTIYVPLPDDATREAILLKAFAKTCVSCDVSLPDLVTQTESFSGAELIQLCQEAGVCAIQDMGATARSISKRHFSTALHHMSLYGMRGK